MSALEAFLTATPPAVILVVFVLCSIVTFLLLHRLSSGPRERREGQRASRRGQAASTAGNESPIYQTFIENQYNNAAPEPSSPPPAEAVERFYSRVYNIVVRGVFGTEDDPEGLYSQYLLLIYVSNPGEATVIRDITPWVRDRGGKEMHVRWATGPEPTSREVGVPFRSAAYVATVPLGRGEAVNIYLYCAIKNVLPKRIDNTTWEATFHDASNRETFKALPTTAMVAHFHNEQAQGRD